MSGLGWLEISDAVVCKAAGSFLHDGPITHAMTSLHITIHWRPVGFVVALFWFWYLGPIFAQSATLARVFAFVYPH